MSIYHQDIEHSTLGNDNYRNVVATGKHMQIVLMSLKPKEEIGMEVHEHVDQFFRIEEGEGIAIVNGQQMELRNGIGLLVPAGAQHNIINTSATESLKLYTIYAPPNHPANTLQQNKPIEQPNVGVQAGGNKMIKKYKVNKY